MAKQRLPMLACNRCGRPAYYEMEVNKRCGLMAAGKECRGRIRFVDRSVYQVGQLIQAIALAMLSTSSFMASPPVDHPEFVRVTVIEGTQATVLELRTHPSDLHDPLKARDGSAGLHHSSTPEPCTSAHL
jgi:hypothetical protein